MSAPPSHVDSATAVGARLALTRKAAGLTQRRLSFPGCTAAYISRVEAGARVPSYQVLAELARRLGVSVDFLARGIPDSAGEPLWRTGRFAGSSNACARDRPTAPPVQTPSGRFGRTAARLARLSSEARAAWICAISCLLTIPLVFGSSFLEDHPTFLTPYASQHVSADAYDLFLATQAAGLGILFGIYFTTAAVLFARQPAMVGPVATQPWFIFPGTLMVYSVALLAGAAFGIRPLHGAFVLVAALDICSLFAFARLGGTLHREFLAPTGGASVTTKH